MISDMDRAYAAGFFDGEGCITIKSPNKTNSFTLCISVGQNDIVPLLWIQEKWGGTICEHNGGHAHRWVSNSLNAGKFLSDIVPLLKVKHQQAVLALELQSTKHRYRYGNTPIPSGLLTRWMDIRNNVMMLNHPKRIRQVGA